MNPQVAIIILNWNGWGDTIECLESLYQIVYSNYDVIVVDNGSEDESIEKIKEYAEGKIPVESKFFEYDPENKPIKDIEYTREEAEAGGGKEKVLGDLPSNRKLILIKNEKNYGFAEGNNIGMRYALKMGTDYVLLLNNDTVVDKEFLGELVKVGESDERIAALQSTLYYYDNSNRIQSIGGKLNLLTGRGGYNIKEVHEAAIKCDRLIGAAMLLRTSAIERIGVFDNQYFLYMEETDWCYRAKRRGFYLMGCSNSKVWHKIYSSSGGKISSTLVYYWTRNFILFYRKNCKYYLPTFLPFFSIYLLKVSILKRQPQLIKCIVYGFIDGIMGRTGMLTRSF